MRILHHFILVPALPLTLFCQGVIDIKGAKVTEVGIFEAWTITAKTNSAGTKLEGLDEFKLLKSTTNVPARIGIRFGFRYEISGFPTNAPITLTMVGKHPPIKNPTTGETTTIDAYKLKSWVGRTYTSYALDDPSDLVPGRWTFEVWYERRKLCEQSFMVMAEEPSSRGTHQAK